MNRDRILELFEYCDGLLIRKISTSSRAIFGDSAGSVRPDGYCEVRIDGKKQLIHRVVFLMFNGYLPDEVDHIDCDRSNNKIENLRPATKLTNSLNQKIRTNNTSGHKGVTWSKTAKKWLARSNTYGKHKCVGYFETKEKAAEALSIFRKNNHGEFANNG